jgi:hypothetical protein
MSTDNNALQRLQSLGRLKEETTMWVMQMTWCKHTAHSQFPYLYYAVLCITSTPFAHIWIVPSLPSALYPVSSLEIKAKTLSFPS